MDCPSCGTSSEVLETRPAEDGRAVRRRRRCKSCERRFTTYEHREPDPLYVIKRDGERQRFDRAKLRAGLLRAAHKRPVDPGDVEVVVDGIESEILAGGGELDSQRVGELCLAGLRDLDLGAYLQFAAVYRELTDLDSVRAELARLGAAAAEEAEASLPDSKNPRKLRAPDSAGSVRPARKSSGLPPKTGPRGDN